MSNAVMRHVVMLTAVLVAAGCSLNANTDCQWTAGHQSRGVDLSSAADRRHLSDDAQTAEDLAIRHADASRRLDWQRNVAEYRRVREECRARLNLIVAELHAVPPGAVAAAVADRREWLDALGNGHMSYRVDRVPLRHRHLETFTAGALCFMVIGAVQVRRKRAN